MQLEVFGYTASVLIGVTLGLIGGGGSILTVPVLVYLFSVDTVAATAYSLFIVGATSAVGSVNYFRQGMVNVRTAIVFGIPSIIAVFLTRHYIVPAIPSEIMRMGDFILTKGIFMMLLFAVLMIAAAYSMIKPMKESKNVQNADNQVFNYPLILVEGLIVGTLTGLVGAGGGFLIIPALVILSKLPMKEAVGTSLVIIAMKSLIGFFGESHSTFIDWDLMLSVSGFAIIGIFIGMFLARHIDGCRLKPAFGWFTLIMGIYIILKETILH
jgi:uncharacterized protein